MARVTRRVCPLNKLNQSERAVYYLPRYRDFQLAKGYPSAERVNHMIASLLSFSSSSRQLDKKSILTLHRPLFLMDNFSPSMEIRSPSLRGCDPSEDNGTRSRRHGGWMEEGRKETRPSGSTRILRARARQFAVRGRFTISGIFRDGILTPSTLLSPSPPTVPRARCFFRGLVGFCR